jgi:hypothetical protein
MLTLKDMLGREDQDLARYDVAAMNLACAADFPDAPSEETVAKCLERLDECAAWVLPYTQCRMPEFRADPGHYRNSEAIFRMVCMLTLLRKQFAIRYNPAMIPAEAQFGTAETFIHGALLGEGGTCASLPVVYVAVGR